MVGRGEAAAIEHGLLLANCCAQAQLPLSTEAWKSFSRFSRCFFSLFQTREPFYTRIGRLMGEQLPALLCKRNECDKGYDGRYEMMQYGRTERYVTKEVDRRLETQLQGFLPFGT
jgi:hypothetical protein